VSTIDVHPNYRRQGVGRALLREYTTAAEAAGCTFIGGSIDLSTDDAGRRTFFAECGFHTNAWDNFGQTTAHLLTALGPRS
jgi:GNAT superfamily N-acetyltransferase